MAEYIDREALLRKIDEERKNLHLLGMDGAEHILARYARRLIEEFPAADVFAVPQEYAYHTCYDDENYLVEFTFPISKKQFDALAHCEDLFDVLRRKGTE